MHGKLKYELISFSFLVKKNPFKPVPPVTKFWLECKFLVADMQLYQALSIHQSVHGHESKSAKMSVLDSFWAAAPKGTKSCRTQGGFRSSVRSIVRPPLQASQVSNLASQA